MNQSDILNYFTGIFLVAQLVKNLSAMQETPVQFLGWEDPLEKGQAAHSSMLGLPWWLSWKETACNAGDLGSIPGMGRSPGEENGYPLQSSDLENSMGCIVHGVAKGWPPLSDFHFQSFPGGSDRKESASNARDASLIPGSGRSSGEGNGNPL